MSADTNDPIARRVANIRFSTAIVLAGFLLNAGLVVLLVSFVSGSVLAALGTLGILCAVVVLVAVFTEWFLLTVSGARPPLEGEFPWLSPMVRDLAEKAGVVEPRVLISDQNALNAYTTGTGEGAKIVFYTRLVRELPREEVRAVAAHELGHILNRDVSLAVWTGAVFAWVLLVKVLAVVTARLMFEFFKALLDYLEDMGPLGALAGMIIAAMGFAVGAFIWATAHAWAFIAQLMQLGLTRQREFLADATSAAITGEPRALAAALAHIAGDPSIGRGASVVGRFCILSPAVGGGWWDEMLSTHPSPDRRIEELNRLPAGGHSPASRDWRGIGSLSLFLPAGTIVLVAVLALAIPLFTNARGPGNPGGPSPGQSQGGGASGPSAPPSGSPPATSEPGTAPAATPSSGTDRGPTRSPAATTTPSPISTQVSSATPGATVTPSSTNVPRRTPTVTTQGPGGTTSSHTPTPSPVRATATLTPTPAKAPTSTGTPTETPTPSPTTSSTPTPTTTPSRTPTRTPTSTPTPTYTSTSTPTLTPTPTRTSIPTPTAVPPQGNVAPRATISWSGDNPGLLVDGSLSAYSTGANLVGFTWDTNVTIHRVIIWNERSRGGINWLNLYLSDGTNLRIDYGGPNDCVRVDFSPRTVNRADFDFNDHDGALALKEIEIWATTGPQSSGNSCGIIRSL